MPKTAYAMSSVGRLKAVTGMRKSGSLPRNERTITTLETAESTTDPRMPALQRPMTSSMTKKDGGKGRVESCSEACGSAHWSHEPKLFTGNLQPAAQGRRDAGSDLKRG